MGGREGKTGFVGFSFFKAHYVFFLSVVSFPIRIFLSLGWVVDTRILTCLGAMTHPQKVWLLWGLLLLTYAINCDAGLFMSSGIPCLLSYSSMGRRKENCSLLFKIIHFKGSFVPLGTQMIFSKQIILYLFIFTCSLKIQAAMIILSMDPEI